MGFTPAEVAAMSYGEFRAAVAGWNRVHGGGDTSVAPPTDEEHDELIRKYG